ncbi:MAG: HD domain-containing protein [Acetivibrio ethanolgignens]
MQFVRTEDLKAGMRLARPIYNKNGVLLYERDTKLTMQGIYSIKNFGLIGIYILEPAEPVPPMTEEDVEFERFQTMAIFTLREILQAVTSGKYPSSLPRLTGEILRNYGRLDHKINFMQNLRSTEDEIYKHSLNTAILAAVMSHKMRMGNSEQNNVIMAALLHDIGKLMLVKEQGETVLREMENNEELLAQSHQAGISLLASAYDMSDEVRAIISETLRRIDDKADKNTEKTTELLYVAYAYDELTAMHLNTAPNSEVMAIRYLMDERSGFNKEAVFALIDSINILAPGTCVELTNGEKGVVLQENSGNILRPMVLGFWNNQIYDLYYDDIFEKLQVKDLMKTMDNRFVIDKKAVEQYMGQVVQKK